MCSKCSEGCCLPTSPWNHAPFIFMLHIFLSPLTSMEKSSSPWKYISLLIIFYQFGEGITPNSCRRYSNVSLGRGFVNLSAICSCVPIYSILMLFSATCSHRKWYLTWMCFLLQCITGFFEILIARLLSHKIRIRSSYVTWMSAIVCFILMSTTCFRYNILWLCCG